MMNNNYKIKTARFQLGQFFKSRREEMGATSEELARHLGITENTLRGVETGRFAWDIDLHFRLCAALEIKPYFSADSPPWEESTLRKEDDPERYHGYYLVENILLWPGQLGILKLTNPRLFVRFNYPESYFSGYEDWKANHTALEWLDPDDKAESPEEIEFQLSECWNFLALHEAEEDNQYTGVDD